VLRQLSVPISFQFDESLYLGEMLMRFQACDRALVSDRAKIKNCYHSSVVLVAWNVDVKQLRGLHSRLSSNRMQ
jgi:hypothetical protein